jgi:hypothetical protein
MWLHTSARAARIAARVWGLNRLIVVVAAKKDTTATTGDEFPSDLRHIEILLSRNLSPAYS